MNTSCVWIDGDPSRLEWAAEAALAWLSARREGREISFAFERREIGPWLDWLQIDTPRSAQRKGSAALPVNAGTGLDSTLTDLYAAGALGEMVLSALVQCRWPAAPARERLQCLSRSELLVYFDAARISPDARAFPLEELWRINGERLQELPPRQILEASLPYWGRFGGPESIDESRSQAMEAWILLHLEGLTNLVEVAELLQWSWKAPTEPSPAHLPEGWWNDPDSLPEGDQAQLVRALVGTACALDLATVVGVLGADLCRARLQAF